MTRTFWLPMAAVELCAASLRAATRQRRWLRSLVMTALPRIIPLIAATTLAAPALAASPYALGLYVGNANGNDAAAMASFKAAFDAHNTIVATKPKFFNAFTDNSNDPSNWAASAGWAAWSNKMSGSAYTGPGSGMIPVIGIPLGWSQMGFANVDQFYIYTSAGVYDSVWSGIVDAWAANGYKILDFRIAYEMNGKFMAWSPENSTAPSAAQDFVAAFQRVASVIHAEAKRKGIQAYVHWNPTAINFTAADVAASYPGDAYVDVISIDEYNRMFPIGYTDWSTGGKVELTDSNAWAAIAANRDHYIRYPNATQYNQTPSLHSTGWSIPQMIEFAKSHGKPIAVDETGAGGGGGLGPPDDAEFPKTLATLLYEAKRAGLRVRNVNIWDATLGDGDWNFQNGSKPQEAAAWRLYFGPPPPAASH